MGTYKETREKTKNLLVEAFWEIYSEKNIEKITIKEITDKAGYNRATFYIYFNDVHDILQYVELQMYDLLNHLDTNIDCEFPIPMNLLQTAVDLFDANNKYLCVLLSQNGDPHFAVNFKKQFKMHLLTKLLRVNVQSSINTDFLLEYLASGILNCILLWYETKPFSVEALIIQLSDITTANPFQLLDTY